MRTRSKSKSKAVKSANKAKGKRYTAAEKKKILDHVQSVNESRGRGGITSASKKYGVTALTISNWMKGPELSYSAKRSSLASGNASETLRRLADLHDEIMKREQELVPLRREFEKLKKSL